MNEKIEFWLEAGEFGYHNISMAIVNDRVLILAHLISSLEVSARPKEMHTIQYTVDGGPAIYICQTTYLKLAELSFDGFKAGIKSFIDDLEEETP